jgi:hypothetical protein
LNAEKKRKRVKHYALKCGEIREKLKELVLGRVLC